ncbi:MAG: molybdate ABC transporter permease subunit [Paracoccaceae bacterium]
MIETFAPLWLTLKLATIVTFLLICLATPLAWWLARSPSRLAPVVEALTALPLVLPPTVLGFYLLLAFTPQAPFGAFWLQMTGQPLVFSFTGLVLASVIYSLPFAVQPLQAAFLNLPMGQLEAAQSMGAARRDLFLSLILPLTRRGYLTAIVLSFAHTLGEFGIVLMVGGNIPGETRVVSIAIYEEVERMNYAAAHTLSGLLLALSFLILLVLYTVNARDRRQATQGRGAG